jgi:hypothetical protein
VAGGDDTTRPPPPGPNKEGVDFMLFLALKLVYLSTIEHRNLRNLRNLLA